MLSLMILVGLLVASLLAAGWAVALAAKLMGSPRGRLRTGLLAALLIVGICLALAAIQQLVPATQPVAMGIAGIGFFLIQVTAMYIVLHRAFSLSVARTFALVGVYIATSLVGVTVAALVMRPNLIEAFVMPTKGMSPTLDPDDRFTVNKVVAPRRWDLVTYHHTDPAHSVYCKRLIGFPGERLRFENGQLYVNDQPVTPPAPLAGRLRASLPGPSTPSLARYADDQTIALGPDEFFLVGDNIDISADSRIYGPSHRASLVGVVDLIYWPPAKIRIVR